MGNAMRDAQTLAVPLESGYVSGAQAGLVRSAVRALLGEVRPDAVALVDAWNFSDHVLGSALGRHDGNVYQALFDWVRAPTTEARTGIALSMWLRWTQRVCVHGLASYVCVCLYTSVCVRERERVRRGA